MVNIFEKAAATLKNMEGLEAVVLGGSRARGNYGPGSDIDIGLYYNNSMNFPLLEEKIRELDQEHRENLLALPGEWGKWQNGGAWLTMDNIPVDVILRDVNAVKTALRESQNGIVTPHYQTGHPHAYFNIMYVGELAVCKLLWGRSDEFRKLKAEAEIYPLKMKNQIIHLFSFEMTFSQMLAEKSVGRDDIYYVTAHIVRSVSAINQVLFALNEEYCINEKQAVNMINGFKICPFEYKKKINKIFTHIGSKLIEACIDLRNLIDEVNSLIEEHSAHEQ